MMPFALRLAAAVLLVSLTGCSALLAQNPSSPLKPVNAVSEGGDEHVMLKGHDVVAYFTDAKHMPGLASIKSVHQGVTFRFASAAHKALFDANPMKYVPQYGGFCANGIAYGIPWGGDADTWRIDDGKLYIFGGDASKRAWEIDRQLNLQRAEKYWAEEVSGSNSFFQRSKRLVLRVPHYKTGAELEAEYAQRKAAGTLKP